MPTERERPRSENPAARRNINYREIADGLMADNGFVSLSSLAKALGCSYWTVYGWWRNDPTFAAAFKTSRQKAVDDVKERAVERAMGTDGQKSSDLMMIYILNNFDEEIVERTSKQRSEITIRLEVPSLAAPLTSWASEVAAAVPTDAVEAKYREILSIPEST